MVEEAALLPPHGAVTGWAALHWLGATRWFDGLAADGSLSIPLAVGGEDIRSQPGIAVNAEHIASRRGGRRWHPGHDSGAVGVLRDALCPQRPPGGARAQHGGVLGPRVSRRSGRLREPALRLDRHPAVPGGRPSRRGELLVPHGARDGAGLADRRRTGASPVQPPAVRPLRSPRRDTRPARRGGRRPRSVRRVAPPRRRPAVRRRAERGAVSRPGPGVLHDAERGPGEPQTHGRTDAGRPFPREVGRRVRASVDRRPTPHGGRRPTPWPCVAA